MKMYINPVTTQNAQYFGLLINRVADCKTKGDFQKLARQICAVKTVFSAAAFDEVFVVYEGAKYEGVEVIKVKYID